jgi:mono/diheme cytochrome c family protein
MTDERIDRPQRRERVEPEELKSPIPRPIAVLAVALLAWGTWYYFQNTGYPVGAGDRRSAVVVATTVDGAAVFAGNCVACHQATGLGLAGIFPPLVGSRWVLENDARLVQILLHGINGPLEVLGVGYNGVMPAFSQLSDAELAAVLTYVRGAWSNDGTPIDEPQIVTGRERFPADRGPWQGGQELNDVFPPAGGD